MAAGLSTYDQLTRAVLLRCPAASIWLSRQWIDYAFRTLWDRRLWSWMVKRSQFLLNEVVTAGVVNVVHGSVDVVGIGTAFSNDLINRQFRVGLATPIYTVIEVTDATHLTLDEPWGGPTASVIGYEIYNVYQTVPNDFQNFISVYDTNFAWQLLLNVDQAELNSVDPQRANNGQAYCVSFYADTTIGNTPPLPTYELWPHNKSQYVYPFLYTSRPPDLSEAGASLPRMIRGDVLLEMALAQCARWPGPDNEHRNPYFALPLAMQHDARAEKMICDMERTDDEQNETDAWYGTVSSWPLASIPWGDSKWLQSHG